MDGVRKHSLLLVDGDPKSQRVLEVSLKKAGFDVVTAADGITAQARLAEQVPDLVISDTQLGGVDGFELCRRLKEDPELARVPFIFLSSKKSIEDKIRGLELGVEDYLTKPIFIKEITTRVRILLQRRERESLESSRDSRTRFTGQLSDIGIVDLVQTIEISRKSGIVHVESSEGRRGAIYFRDGRVIDAEVARLTGVDALYRLFSWAEGRFEVEFKPLRRRDVIEQPVQALLMEGMRRLDEWTRQQESLPPLDAVLQVDYHVLAERLADIPDEVNQVLRLFDGRRALAQVIEDAELPDLETAAAIGRLFRDQVLFLPSGERAPVEVRGTMGRLERWLSESSWAGRPGSNEVTPVPELTPGTGGDQPTARFQTLYGVGAPPVVPGGPTESAQAGARVPTPPPHAEIFQTLPGYATSPLARAEPPAEPLAAPPSERAHVVASAPAGPGARDEVPVDAAAVSARRKERINTSPYGTPAALDAGLLEEDPEGGYPGQRAVSGQIDIPSETGNGRHVTTETFFTLQADASSVARVAGEHPAVPDSAAAAARGEADEAATGPGEPGLATAAGEPPRPGVTDPTRSADEAPAESPTGQQEASDDPRALPAVAANASRALHDDERTPGPSVEFRALSRELAAGEPEAAAAAPSVAPEPAAAASPEDGPGAAPDPAPIDGRGEPPPAKEATESSTAGEGEAGAGGVPTQAAADAEDRREAEAGRGAEDGRDAGGEQEPPAAVPRGTSLIYVSPRDSSQLVHADPRQDALAKNDGAEVTEAKPGDATAKEAAAAAAAKPESADQESNQDAAKHPAGPVENPGPTGYDAAADLERMSRSEMLDELGQRPGRGLGIAAGVALVLGGAIYLYVSRTGSVAGDPLPAASSPAAGLAGAAAPPPAPDPASATPGGSGVAADRRPSLLGGASSPPGEPVPGAPPSAAAPDPRPLPPVQLPGAASGAALAVAGAPPAAAPPPAPLAAAPPPPAPPAPTAQRGSAGVAPAPPPPAADVAELERACDQAYKKGRYKDALASCGALAQAQPDQPHILVNVAHASLERGNVKAALTWARKAVALDPSIADAWVFIGGAEQELGNHAAARAAYQKYLDLAPDGKYARDLRVIVESL